MAWKKRSSGKRYDSSNANSFIIGGKIKGINGMVLYFMAWRKCDAIEKGEEESE